MTAPFRSIVLSPKSLALYGASFALFAVGLYGIWGWFHSPFAADISTQRQALLVLGIAGLLPLATAVLVAIYAAAYTGQRWSSTGFQNRIDQLMSRLNEQDDMFRMLTDQTPSALTIFNDKNEYWFINASAASMAGCESALALGKTPAAVLGADKGRRIERHLETVRQNGKPFETVNRESDGRGHVRFFQARYQPLMSVSGISGGILERQEDVTFIVVERERREATLRQVIAALVAVVDRRDPYASGHSARVGQLARALAAEMLASDRDAEAAEIAGSLMNFGKVLVSRSILTKNEGLSPEELRRIRDGILTSAEILSLIDFGAPVVATLRQVLERVDGAGVPNGLRGEEIMLTARIVAVANAFVAMVSPRAYRPGVPFLEAIARLGQQAGKAFDPAVIAALEGYLRKNDGKLGWLAAGRAAE